MKEPQSPKEDFSKEAAETSNEKPEGGMKGLNTVFGTAAAFAILLGTMFVTRGKGGPKP